MSERVFDTLGDRMKGQYEDRTRYMLPRRTWTVVRVDGKAFHSFTRHCEKPFDAWLAAAMVAGALRLVEEAQGAKFGYVQSDEISVVLTDFDRVETCAWFDGNLQKIASVSASLVTAGFNAAYANRAEGRTAIFDARAFTIPDPIEVENYFIWRQKDAIRNSVQSYAQSHYSPKVLHGKKQDDMRALIAEAGTVWAHEPPHLRHGIAITYDENGWRADYNAPTFTEQRTYLQAALTRPAATEIATEDIR